MPEVVVLRWGHRLRDKRLTTHVALTARALGAAKLILADVRDEKIKEKIESVTKSWGGHFIFEMGVPWKQAVKEWKKKKGLVVHLTAYGENVGLAFQTRDDILDQGEDSGENHISRPNSVHLFGGDESRRRLRAFVAEALGALEREALESEELYYLASLLLDAAEDQKSD